MTGCVAKADGKYTRYNASKGVVLATGDFSQDKDMVAKYCPIALPFGNGGVYDGSGLKLALWIGAAWQKYTPNAPMLATMGDEVLPCRWWAEGALTTFPGLLVNNKGVRYSNENCTYGYMPYPQRVQPDGCAFLIWDANWVDASAPWQGDRIGGEARDTEEVKAAIEALFDPNTDWTTTDEYAGFDATMAETAVKARCPGGAGGRAGAAARGVPRPGWSARTRSPATTGPRRRVPTRTSASFGRE